MDLKSFSRLLQASGPSGQEEHVTGLWLALAHTSGLITSLDGMGNAFASQLGPPDRCKIMINGHSDQIGIIVSYIDDEGFLYFKTLGGWDPAVFVGQRIILGRQKPEPVIGVVGRKAIHMMDDKEESGKIKIDELWIDCGFSSKEEAEKVISVGDTGTLLSGEPHQLNADLLTSAALDNRVGCFVALEVAKQVSNSKVQAVAVVSANEEIWGPGANAVTAHVKPDMAVAVDLTFSADHPGVEKAKFGNMKLGKGPVIAIGGALPRWMSNKLITLAQGRGIPFQLEAVNGATWTNADKIMGVGQGVPTALVGVPSRYMHTPNEVVSISDIENTIKLLVAFCDTMRN